MKKSSRRVMNLNGTDRRLDWSEGSSNSHGKYYDKGRGAEKVRLLFGETRCQATYPI